MKTLRQFTSMVNRRIHRLADTFGVDANVIIEELGIDGVYMEYDNSNPNDRGQLVINEQFYNQDLVDRLTEAIPTIATARTEATKAIRTSTYVDENFIGPMPNRITANQIAREIQARYEVRNAWQEIREKYYEIEQILVALGRDDLIDKISQFGSDFNAEDVSYTDLLKFRDTILGELDNAF